ncbi:MAG: L-fuconolactonase [Acidimicrobiales bacterium]|jgi:L-fuconolactonase
MEPGSQEWLDQVVEDVVDADQRIIDPHHHLWPAEGPWPYGLDELHGDTSSGHDIQATVFVECHAAYRTDGPKHLRSVGETDFVAEQAARSAERSGQAEIRAIVANADLRRPELDEVLDAHVSAGQGRFRGIRHAIAHTPDVTDMQIAGQSSPYISADPAFRRGLTRLGERGLTYDSWNYHFQNREVAVLAAAAPGTTMVLDHFGTPIGVGAWQGQLDEIYPVWQDDIAAIAKNENVVAKIGGLAMPDNGYGWHSRGTPATSDEIVAAHERWYLHAIDCFGPERCMFESNFPVDRLSVSYRVMWNALKKIASRFTPDERDQMFWGTAERVYSLSD